MRRRWAVWSDGRLGDRWVASGLIGVLLAVAQLGPSSEDAIAAQWTLVPMRPQPAADVAASDPSSVWAFGLAVQRWTGTAWQVVGTPVDRYIRSAVVDSASNIRAVGNAPTGPRSHGVVLRWDGHAWHTVLRVKRGGALLGMSRVPGTQRFWAVGYHVIGARATPIIRRRGARGWHPIATPPVKQGTLYAVASSPRTSWAVGTLGNGTTALAERWVQGQWVITPVPDSKGITLLDVTAAAGSQHAWAVGYRDVRGDRRPVVYHWSHMGWHSVPIDLGRHGGELDSVISIRPGYAWAVGNRVSAGFAITTLVEHWTHGPSWHAVASPTPTSGCGWTLHAITQVPRTARRILWAVGDNGCSFQTISERHW